MDQCSFAASPSLGLPLGALTEVQVPGEGDWLLGFLGGLDLWDAIGDRPEVAYRLDPETVPMLL